MLPDLEANINNVLLKSDSRIGSKSAGSVESKIIKGSSDSKFDAAMTSGAREDPPIPQRTIRSIEFLRRSAAIASNLGKS